MIEAKVIADSVNPAGSRLTTFLITYPRFILAEINTHRMLSRSTASSRAIPVSRRIKAVQDNPVVPLHWGLNQSGMQASEEASAEIAAQATEVWLWARDQAVIAAEKLKGLNIHKQAANRLLEPFCYCTTVISATDWANFFCLRWHPKAQPEFFMLAEAMREVYVSSVPTQLDWDEWHLPFVTDEERCSLSLEDQINASAARCARTSFENHDGSRPQISTDNEVCHKLFGDIPVHASPSEHPAFACGQTGSAIAHFNHDHGNYRGGWHQFRKTIPNENLTTLPWELSEGSELCTPQNQTSG